MARVFTRHLDATRERAGGFALVVVMVTLALAGVIAYAVLASAAVRSTAFANGLAAEQAERVARAGVAYAMRQLQAPGNCGSSRASPWEGENGVALPGGTADITVTDLGSDRAKILSTANVGGVTRTRTVTVQANWTWVPKAAIETGSSALTLPALSTIVGDLVSGGNVKFAVGTTMTGMVVAPSVTNLLSGLETECDDDPRVVVKMATDYSTYFYNGQTYNATPVGPTLSNVTLGPTASNPAGIYIRSSGSLTVSGNVVVNGTLVSKGLLTVNGTGNVFTAEMGYPAIVAQDKLSLGALAQLNVCGMVYVGKGLLNGLGSKLTVNGGLLISSGGFLSVAGLTLNVTLNMDKACAPDLDCAPTAPSSLTLLSWK